MGLLLLIFAATLAGCAEAYKLARRVRQLEILNRFIGVVQTEIRYSALPLYELCRRHEDEFPFLKPCIHAYEESGDFPFSFQQCLHEMGLASNDMELMQGFGDGLGTTDIEGQVAHCTLYQNLLETRLEEARGEKNGKSRLYVMLGTSGGITAALLLW